MTSPLEQVREERIVMPVRHPFEVDLLFVIDDSPSMQQEQASLVRNMARFAQVLEQVHGGAPSLHIGVVSSNVGTGPGGGGGPACAGDGDDGILQVPAGCAPLSDDRRFIRDVQVWPPGTRERNYTGELADQLACMADLGADGCGFAQHLEAMRRALSNEQENAGFLRQDAHLMVVFIQDEDDCSARDRSLFDPGQDDRDAPLGELSTYRCFEFGTTCDSPSDERAVGPRQGCRPDEDPAYLEPVATYVDFLRRLKDGRNKVIVAAVAAGDAPIAVGIDPDRDQLRLEPQCVVCPGGSTDCYPDALDQALVAGAPALRMGAFLDAFAPLATFQSLCTYHPGRAEIDFSGALVQLAYTLELPEGIPCLKGRLTTPPQCAVSDVTNLYREDQTERLLPPCEDSDTRPCWQLVPNNRCETGSGLALEILREVYPPPGTTVVARCLVE